MKVLLLAGTSDARRLAQSLAGASDLELIASLAGVTRDPVELPCTTRIGGFGGEEGFEAYLKDNEINAVVDATHPFAAKMSETAASVCLRQNLPHLQILRPQWSPQPGDNWHPVHGESDCAGLIPVGANVFLATGRQTLPGFANLDGRRLICRQIDPTDRPFPFANGEFLVGRPPFSIAEEVALFTRLKINWLVVKNSGAEASRSKLDAARELGMPVAMIRRPKAPDCQRVESVAAALDWVRALGVKQ